MGIETPDLGGSQTPNMEPRVEAVLEAEGELHEEPYDIKWYSRMEDLGSFEDFLYLQGAGWYRDEEKTKFISGENENPTLDHPKLTSEFLQSRLVGLVTLKEEIEAQEQNDFVRGAYVAKINHRLAEAAMLQATLTGDMKRFKKYSEFIYGKPSPEIYSYFVNKQRQKAQKLLESDDERKIAAAKDFLESFPEVDEPEIQPVPREVVKEVQAQVQTELKEIWNVQLEEGEKEYTGEDVMGIVESGLDSLRAEGWKAQYIDAGGFSVNQESRIVNVPRKGKYKATKLYQLLTHEVFTHVAKRVLGARSKLLLIQIGLDRYDIGEEGQTTMREQAVFGTFKDYAGEPGYVSISLANGMEGDGKGGVAPTKPRNFRETFDMMKKYQLISAMSDPKATHEAAEKTAADSAWNNAVRTFRGTDCETRGACLNRDLVYAEGSIKMWRLAQENGAGYIMGILMLGKYDPSNPKHQEIVSGLDLMQIQIQEDITNEDLSRLEQPEQAQ